MSRNYLIIGTGRCGTGYAAKTLRAAGFQVGHERLLSDGISHWKWMSPSARRGVEFKHIIHVVREPLATIGSLTTIHLSSWNYVCSHSVVQRSMPLLSRCIHHWWNWNLLCESQAEQTIQVERFLETFPDLPPPAESISVKTNSRPHESVSWADVELAAPALADCVKRMAERWGYLCH